MGTALDKATVAELDALASEHGLSDYPADGLKADKLESVSAALGHDFEFDVPPSWTLRLDPYVNGGQFQSATGDHVELTQENPEYVTSNANEARALSELPFLSLVGEDS